MRERGKEKGERRQGESASELVLRAGVAILKMVAGCKLTLQSPL